MICWKEPIADEGVLESEKWESNTLGKNEKATTLRLVMMF